MTRITRALATLAAAIMIMAGLSAGTTAEAAKDITWGRHAASAGKGTPQAKDITWGRRKGILNDVTHASDDSGWAGPIHIVCGGQHVYLKPGEKSALGVNSQCGTNVERWIVPAGHTYYCKNALPPYQNRYIYVGSTDVPSYSSWKCYDQKAL